VEQAGVLRGRDSARVQSEVLDSTTEQSPIPERLRRSGEHEEAGLERERVQALHEALLDLAGHRRALGQPEPAGELRGRPRARQLDERERISVALRDDLLPDGGIQRAPNALHQQGAHGVVPESLDRQLGASGQHLVADAGARGTHERDPLREKAPGREAEHLRGGIVEPMGVVDDAHERIVLRDVGEQPEHGHADEEPVRGIAGVQAERRGERTRLWPRQVIEPVEHGTAQLVQARKRQLHLGLDARCADDATSDRPLRQVVEERGLADAGLPAQDEHLTPSGACVHQHSVECRTFRCPAVEHRSAAHGVDGRPRVPAVGDSGFTPHDEAVATSIRPALTRRYPHGPTADLSDAYRRAAEQF
jgi:hypothetical protein